MIAFFSIIGIADVKRHCNSKRHLKFKKSLNSQPRFQPPSVTEKQKVSLLIINHQILILTKFCTECPRKNYILLSNSSFIKIFRQQWNFCLSRISFILQCTCWALNAWYHKLEKTITQDKDSILETAKIGNSNNVKCFWNTLYIQLQNYFYAVMLLNPKGNECCSFDKILLKPIYGLINHDHRLLFRWQKQK